MVTEAIGTPQPGPMPLRLAGGIGGAANLVPSYSYNS
jgi:hypothetical protein